MTISNAHLIPCFTFCIPLSHLSHSCVPVVANDRSADLCYLLAYKKKTPNLTFLGVKLGVNLVNH
jgi:hypothetical protein